MPASIATDDSLDEELARDRDREFQELETLGDNGDSFQHDSAQDSSAEEWNSIKDGEEEWNSINKDNHHPNLM